MEMELYGVEWWLDGILFGQHPNDGFPPLAAAAFDPTSKRNLRFSKRRNLHDSAYDEPVQYRDSERCERQWSMDMELYGVGWWLDGILLCLLVLVVTCLA